MDIELPAQIQRQMAEVEAYDKSIADAEAEAAPVDPNATVDAVVTPPAVETPETPAAPAAPVDQEETWKARYLSLQGMFNKDVPRLNSEVKSLTATVAALKAELEVAKAATKTPPAPKPSDAKDVEAFGVDLLDVVDRRAQAVLSQAQADWDADRKALEAEIATLKQNTGTVAERQATNDRQRYVAELAAQVPEWEAINVNPDFLGWLSQVDELSGLTRQKYLENAYNNFDSARTAKLFQTWKATATPPAPAGKTPAQQQLERQVAPAGSTATVTPSTDPAAGKVWTTDEIDNFWKDVRKGLYHGKDAEAKRIESEIDAAVAAGRVTT